MNSNNYKASTSYINKSSEKLINILYQSEEADGGVEAVFSTISYSINILKSKINYFIKNIYYFSTVSNNLCQDRNFKNKNNSTSKQVNASYKDKFINYENRSQQNVKKNVKNLNLLTEWVNLCNFINDNDNIFIAVISSMLLCSTISGIGAFVYWFWKKNKMIRTW